jgi:hypothetical protein
MLYLVQAHASMERANTADSGEGPGPVLQRWRSGSVQRLFMGIRRGAKYLWW